jgi:hypothetical protein
MSTSKTFRTWTNTHDFRYDEYLADAYKYRNTTLVRNLTYPPDEVGNLPPSLSLAQFAGKYSNGGYGDWYIRYENHMLWNNTDRQPAYTYNAELEHISGGHFLIIAYSSANPEDPFYFPAEFRVGIEGKADRLGVVLEEGMEGAKIWFDRVD